MAHPAIFLDRDGVINANRDDYVKSWVEFTFLPGSLAALVRLAQMDRPIVVVTNQSAIGRDIVPAQRIEQIHRRMVERVEKEGGRIDLILYCPHHPQAGCDCRKPQPGLLLQAQEALNLDLTRSFLVGDALSDLAAAQQAGCVPILVRTGRGLDQLRLAQSKKMTDFAVVDDLSQAVDWIQQFAAKHEDSVSKLTRS